MRAPSRRPSRRAFSVLLAAASLLATSAALAGGTAPSMQRFDFAYDNEPMVSCGAFVIMLDGAGTTHITTFFDRHGDPIRATMHGNYSGMMTNSVTGASIADAPSVANLTLDLVSGVQTNVGAFWTVTVPGEGAVLIDAGRLVFDGSGPPVFIAGPHLPVGETIDILCAALS